LLDGGADKRNMCAARSPEEVSSMCHEFWMRRREREAQEAREVWLDFERTSPMPEPQLDVEGPDPAEAGAPEEPATADR